MGFKIMGERLFICVGEQLRSIRPICGFSGYILASFLFVFSSTVYGEEPGAEDTGEARNTIFLSDDGATVSDNDVMSDLDDSITLSMGGDVRVRWEYWDAFAFNPDLQDDYFLVRLRLHSDISFRNWLRIFVEGKSAGATERDLPGGRRTLDVDTLALQNAYVEISVPLAPAGEFTLRPGRQELLYGSQRLVSPLDWSNTRRTFDGGTVIYEHGIWNIDAFWVRPVEIRKYKWNKTDTDTDFFGVYAARNDPGDDIEIDLYWLGVDGSGVMFGERLAREERYTVGMRMGSPPGLHGLDFDVEGAWQYGDHGDRDIRAFFLASELGFTFEEAAAAPRVHTGLDYASGDRDRNDGTLNTFNQLFPLGHAFLGYADMIGRQNIVAGSLGLTLSPSESLRIRIDGHHFRRASRSDAVYNAGGQVLRSGDAGNESEVGTEMDITLTYRFTPDTSTLLGYSRFWAGSFIRESGPSGNLDFAYASISQRF